MENTVFIYIYIYTSIKLLGKRPKKGSNVITCNFRCSFLGTGSFEVNRHY